MKRFIPLYLLCPVVLLCSCRSLKNLTAKDVSSSEQPKKKNNSSDAVFLDNVSVTPGSTEKCTDCSGFTQNLMRDVYAINIPRTAQEQYNSSTHIKTEELRQGDLVFFQNSSHNISHVGLYVANNKFVHASVSNGVMIS